MLLVIFSCCTLEHVPVSGGKYQSTFSKLRGISTFTVVKDLSTCSCEDVTSGCFEKLQKVSCSDDVMTFSLCLTFTSLQTETCRHTAELRL